MDNFSEIIKELPPSVELIAVSKNFSEQHIINIYNKGQRIFGENKVQELVNKQLNLPKDIQWHFIGHLQTNKVRQIVPFVSLIHSVDSYKLLLEINKQAKIINKVVDCLLEIKIAKEENKYGISYDESVEIIEKLSSENLDNIKLRGLMGMATFTNDKTIIRKEFNSLKNHFLLLKEKYFAEKHYFSEISMGMSSDYKIAIEEGATMIRIGTLIFGSR